MNLPQIKSNYLERYGEDEGLSLYMQFLQFMEETSKEEDNIYEKELDELKPKKNYETNRKD